MNKLFIANKIDPLLETLNQKNNIMRDFRYFEDLHDYKTFIFKSKIVGSRHTVNT